MKTIDGCYYYGDMSGKEVTVEKLKEEINRILEENPLGLSLEEIDKEIEGIMWYLDDGTLAEIITELIEQKDVRLNSRGTKNIEHIDTIFLKGIRK